MASVQASWVPLFPKRDRKREIQRERKRNRCVLNGENEIYILKDI
jgi:hypothetical protein